MAQVNKKASRMVGLTVWLAWHKKSIYYGAHAVHLSMTV